MSALLPDLVLGGIQIPQAAGYDLAQDYEDLEGAGTVRMSNGSVRKITTWNGKIRTEVNGSGRLPPLLNAAALDYSTTMTMKCVAPRGIRGSGTSNAITIPAARRSDLTPSVIGVAILSGLNIVEASVASVVGNVVTLTAVSGAVGYIALYFPEITVWASPPTEEFDRGTARWRWRLQAEEA